MAGRCTSSTTRPRSAQPSASSAAVRPAAPPPGRTSPRRTTAAPVTWPLSGRSVHLSLAPLSIRYLAFFKPNFPPNNSIMSQKCDDLFSYRIFLHFHQLPINFPQCYLYFRGDCFDLLFCCKTSRHILSTDINLGFVRKKYRCGLCYISRGCWGDSILYQR